MNKEELQAQMQKEYDEIIDWAIAEELKVEKNLKDLGKYKPGLDTPNDAFRWKHFF